MRPLRAAFVALASGALLGLSPAVPTEDQGVVDPQLTSSVATVQDLIEAAAEAMDFSRWEDAIQTLTLVLKSSRIMGSPMRTEPCPMPGQTGWTKRRETWRPPRKQFPGERYFTASEQ